MIPESIICGIAYRIRGGLLDQILGRELPNLWIRSAWALAVTAIIVLKTGMILVSPLIFAFALLGVLPGYFGGAFDLTLPENQIWKNYARLAAHGIFTMLPLAGFMSIMFYNDIWYAVAAGALMPAYYLIGTKLPEIKSIVSHSQYGEWLLGLSIGAALGI